MAMMSFFINPNGILHLNTSTFLIHPDLTTAAIGGITEDATKVNYYTPEFSGFQFGVSYTPDEGDGGQFANRLDSNGDFENVFGAGLTYNKDYGHYNVNAGLVGETGSAEATGTEDLQAWQVGGTVQCKQTGISLAGSYGDWGNSSHPVNSNAETHFWTAGIAYEADKAGVSATYFDSEHADNNYKSVVIGADYKVADGLTPYIETTFFEADEAGTNIDNEGNVVLIGTYVNF